MKIVHLITSLKVGGAESLLYNFLLQVDIAKHEHVIVYFHEGSNARKIEGLGFRMHHIEGLFSPYDPRGLFSLLRTILKEKPDLLHTSLWSANILGQLLAFLFRIPVISDLHNDLEKQGWFRNKIQALTARIPHCYVAVSAAVKNSFYAAVVSEKKLKIPINIIVNGIDVEKIEKDARSFPHSREQLGVGPHDFIIGTVGRLIDIKGHNVLIEAFSRFRKRVSNTYLCIVGDGPNRANLEELSQTLRISNNVFFLGEHPTVAPFYALFDCFVLPSLSEGMSIALLEGLAMGLPIITTAHNGKHEVITNNVNGFLVKPENSSMLFDALLKLYMLPEYREVMRKQNKNFVQRNFNIHETVQKYEKIYSRLEENFRKKSLHK